MGHKNRLTCDQYIQSMDVEMCACASMIVVPIIQPILQVDGTASIPMYLNTLHVDTYVAAHLTVFQNLCCFSWLV